MEQNAVFLANFQSIFDETAPEQIQLSTNFKDLEEWSSLMILSLIVMCEEEYNVKLSPTDIEKAQRVEDLYRLVNQ